MDQNTVALLHFEDGFKDECGNVWAAVGTPKLDATEKHFGNSALHIPGNSYLQTVNERFKFGTGDFTIDFWTKTNGGWPTNFVSSARYNPTAIIGVGVCLDGVWIGTNSTTTDAGALSITVNKWTHIAVVKNNQNFMVFVDGSLKKKVPVISSGIIVSDKFAIGARYGDGQIPSQPFHMDELRISNIARWTDNFTPPDKPYEPGEAPPAPASLVAVGAAKKITLAWNVVAGTTGYNVKRSLATGGPYATIANNISTTTYEDIDVAPGTIYYYVVTAISGSGESINSNEAFATPIPSAPAEALLEVTLADEIVKEYQLSMEMANAFIAWYDAKAAGSGPAHYDFTKICNPGPFVSRKDYLIFDKIICFEVKKYLG